MGQLKSKMFQAKVQSEQINVALPAGEHEYIIKCKGEQHPVCEGFGMQTVADNWLLFLIIIIILIFAVYYYKTKQ